MIGELKTAAGVLVVVGIAIGFINTKYAPHALLLESSPNRPRWLPWLAWGLSSVSALTYVVVDHFGEGSLEQPPMNSIALLYWLVAVVFSLFYGARACGIFSVETKDRLWEWHVHQFWFNLLGSLVGWSLAWPLVQQAAPCVTSPCKLQPTGWDAAALFVAFVGVAGYLPQSVIGLIGGLRELFAKVLELAKKSA